MSSLTPGAPATDTTRRRRGTALLVGFGIIHRAVFLAYHSNDLRQLITVAPAAPTWQYLSIPGLTEHFWLSLLYLQQTPPIPNMILGLVVKCAGWPSGTAFTLIALQAGISIATAVLLQRLLGRLNHRPYLNTAVAFVFLLSTDLLVMEYHFLGQLIYENLAMLLATWTADRYLRLRETDDSRCAVQLGAALALLALTRSLYAYFFVVLLAFILSNRRIHRGRHAAVVLLCVCLGQGGWAAKNFLVYGTASLNTSSWVGVNFAIGLGRAGQRDAFVESILDDAGRYPDWFVRMVREKGLVHWHPPDFELYVPAEVREQEHAIQSILRGTNQSENSIGQRLISDLYFQAYGRYLARFPRQVWDKVRLSYVLFWQPIRNYSDLFVAPLRIEPRVTNSFRLGRVWQAYFTPPGETEYWEAGYKIYRPIHFFTIPYLPILMLIINLLVVHGAVPLLLCGDFVARRYWKRPIVRHEWVFLVACYAYVALTANLAEHGENMRFRLSIEPLLWALSVATITTLRPGRPAKGITPLNPAP